MKNKFWILLVVIMMFCMGSVFASAEVIEVQFNGEMIDFTDEQGNKVEPALINGRTMVPMRKIFEELGMDVIWSPSSRTVTARNDEKTIILAIDSTLAKIEEEGNTKEIQLDAAPLLLDNRTMVPVRFIAESLEKQVGWDARNRVVVIIDYTDMVNDFKEKCSHYMEMTKEQTVALNTFDVEFSFDQILEYKDLEERANNQKLNLSGTMGMKKADDRVEVKLKMQTKGKGVLQEAMKEQGYDNLTYDIIYDAKSQKMYGNSSLLEEVTDGKWIMTDAKENYLEKWNLENEEKKIEDIFMLKEENLTKDSYQSLYMTYSILTELFGDDHIKVSGTKTKTYTMSWDLEDILPILMKDSKQEMKEITDLANAKLEIKNTYKNGMNTKLEINLTANVQSKDTKEKITIKLEGEGKVRSYNKPITITLPKESKIFTK